MATPSDKDKPPAPRLPLLAGNGPDVTMDNNCMQFNCEINAMTVMDSETHELLFASKNTPIFVVLDTLSTPNLRPYRAVRRSLKAISSCLLHTKHPR